MRAITDRQLIEEFESHELSRRQLLRAAVGLATASVVGCGVAEDEPTGESSDELRSRTAVGMGYHATDLSKAIDAALLESRGLASIRAGDSVYLKVNTNSGDDFPYSTSPALLEHIGGLLRDKGVTDLRIGDRSFWGDTDTAGNFVSNGIAQAAQRLGTQAVVFDDDIPWVTLPAGSMPDWTGSVRIPAMVATAKHIINLANMKTHFITGFTMTLKNAIGIIHATDRKRRGNLFVHSEIDGKLGRQIAQISKAITPTLNIIDGWRALITGGPTPSDQTEGRGGNTARPRVVIASGDRVAADLTGMAVLRTLCPATEPITQGVPFDHPQIAAAIARGVGITKRSQYSLHGPTVPNLTLYRQDVLS